MAHVRHRIGIRGPSSTVFAAVTQPVEITKWWSTTASGAAAAGQSINVGFGGRVTLTFNVLELIPGEMIHLECPDGPGPWNGSRLRFALEEADNQVFVTLTHGSEKAAEDDFLYFNTKWPIYLLSLRDLIETGTGRPSPHDIPIYYGDNVHSNTA